MAEVAAPFVHRKPTKDNPRILAPRKHVALMKAVRKGNPAQSDAADAKAGKPSTLTADGATVDQSPLEYLMGVMRDPDTRPEVRIRVARTVVPLVHPKQRRDPKADKAEAEQMEALGDEFMVDPELAAKIRDDLQRLAILGRRCDTYFRRKANEPPPTQAEIEEKAALEARVEENAIAIGCPPGYGPEEHSTDYMIADRFDKKRDLPPPNNRLTEMELLLEAQAEARLAAYQRRPVKRAWRAVENRLAFLHYRALAQPALYKEEYQRLRASLPPELLAEHRDLDAPRRPNPEDPLYEAILAWREESS